MKKMLFINSLISLSITSLMANATLDEMYKEMKEIANSQIQENESKLVKVEKKEAEAKQEPIIVNKEVVVVKDTDVKKVELQKEDIKKSEAVKVELRTPAIPEVAVIPKPIVPRPPVALEISKSKSLDVPIAIPTIPQVPKVISVNGSTSNSNDRTIKFSKRVPPEYTGPKFGKKDIVAKAVTKEVQVGEVNAGKISAYLRGEILEVTDVEKRLKDAGFTILTSAKLDKKGKLVSIVFTNKELIAMASKPNRGFASTLRVLVNQKKKQISITNPLYLLKGFLQDDFDKDSAKKILIALTSKFDNLKNSGDQLKFQLLPKYQFMSGLPYYKDSIVVASGDNLLDKIKENKRVYFEQKLNNGSVIVGVHLNKRTNSFLKKIGSKNAAMLPLLVLIEDAKATILDPKYYISIMYPRLTMSEFMKIATIPDAMVKDSKRVFR